MNIENADIELEAYALIRREARRFDREIDDTGLGCYVRGIVDLQTAMYGYSHISKVLDDAEGKDDADCN